MLDEESEQIREVYARYGLAMYQAQCLERGLAMVLATLNPERMTAWDYDARLAENFESTFGQMVTRFAEVAGDRQPELLEKLKRAVDERNKLTHHYFWENAVPLCSTEGRSQLISELEDIGGRFAALDEEVSTLTAGLVPDETLREYLEKLLTGVEAPHDPVRVPNPILLVAAYEWRVGAPGDIKSKLILVSDTGKKLVLGEKGMCFGPQTIASNELFLKANFTAALPAQVNPRPRKAKDWDYTVPLAKGYELRVRPAELNGKPVCRFGLYKASSAGKSFQK